MSRSTRAASTAPTAIESLESRRMLSAAVEHGVLVIEGTRRADVISVALDGARTLNVTVNGRQSSFDRRSIGRICIVAGCGDDQVSLNNGGRAMTAGALVLGGAGNDSLAGGAGDDTLRGEDGDDQLEGMGGNDLLQGGGGKDQLMGDDGDDRLSGDSGADQLWGGDGDDTLFGGRGDDTLHEDAGRDRVCGNDGADLFYFIDSPKDVRDETRGETIVREVVMTYAPFPGILQMPIVTPPISNYIGGSFGGLGSLTDSGLIINSNSGVSATGGGLNVGSGGIGTGTINITGSTGGSVSGGNSGGGLISTGGTGGITLNGGVTSILNPPPIVGGTTLGGGIIVEGGPLGDHAVLSVPAGSVLTVGNGQPQTFAAGTTLTVTGPLRLVTPSGDSLGVNLPWTLTFKAPADPVTQTDVTSPT
jgi:hypothetical protein